MNKTESPRNSSSFFRPWNEVKCSLETDEDSSRTSPDSISSNKNNESIIWRPDSVENDECIEKNSLKILRNFVDKTSNIESQNLLNNTSYYHPNWYYHFGSSRPDWILPNEFDAQWLQEYQNVHLAVTEINRQEALAKQAKKLRPKKFKCDYCPMTFSNNGQLQGHLRIHTGNYLTKFIFL